MDKAKLQAKLDLKKWNDSTLKGVDMCGAYDYCAYCNKAEEMPCASAFERYQEVTPNAKMPIRKSKRSGASLWAKDQHVSLGKTFDYDKAMAKKAQRKSLTFAEKYALSSDIVKERYAALKEALTAPVEGKSPIKSRISKQCDTYRRNGQIVAKITIIGTSLRLNLDLDPNAPEFNNGTVPHVDMTNKKTYSMVPFQIKVNSKLALKRALELIDKIK